jgi:hypothetical protein
MGIAENLSVVREKINNSASVLQKISKFNFDILFCTNDFYGIYEKIIVDIFYNHFL